MDRRSENLIYKKNDTFLLHYYFHWTIELGLSENTNLDFIKIKSSQVAHTVSKIWKNSAIANVFAQLPQRLKSTFIYFFLRGTLRGRSI